MDKTGLYDLLERYLQGALPDAERKEFEQKLASDPALQAELELQRQIHREFANPKKLAMRDMLRDIVEETPAPAPPSGRRRRWLGILVLLLIATWAGWHWIFPVRAPEPAPAQPANPEQQQIKDPETLPSQPANPDTHARRPMAVIDPAAFKPNPRFEKNIRGENEAFNLQSPKAGALFSLENGKIRIIFKGDMPQDAEAGQHPLIVKVFSNTAATDQPSHQFYPAFADRSAAATVWNFETVQSLALKPGLYYFTIERLSDEQLLHVGKFTVGATPGK